MNEQDKTNIKLWDRLTRSITTSTGRCIQAMAFGAYTAMSGISTLANYMQHESPENQFCDPNDEPSAQILKASLNCFVTFMFAKSYIDTRNEEKQNQRRIKENSDRLDSILADHKRQIKSSTKV